MSGVEELYYVRRSRNNVDDQYEGSSLGNFIGSGFIADVGYYDDRAGGDESGEIEVCDTGGVSNGKFSVNIRENPLGGVLDNYSGLGTWGGQALGIVEALYLDLYNGTGLGSGGKVLGTVP